MNQGKRLNNFLQNLKKNSATNQLVKWLVISIQTHNGDLDLELRTEHNGYYSGWIKFVNKEPIWPIHDDIREEALTLLEATE